MEQVLVGVDLGGTFIKFGIFKENGELLGKWQVPTGERAAQAVLSKITWEIVEKSGYAVNQMKGVGIGIPGAVDGQGMIINAPNLGWRMLDIKEPLLKKLSIPVQVGNDANVAALGEQYFGVGGGCSSMVMVTLGTGVGGGVIIDGRLVPGAFGGGGEIGHIQVNDQETVACGCGNKGCLEQYASATGIASLARRELERTDEASLLRSCTELTAKDVFDAVKDRDILADRVAEQFGQALAKALSYIACTVDPEVFVIGGGVSAAGPVLLNYIEKYYRQFAFTPSKQTPFKLAALGNDAGIYGAARLVMLNK
ncbi:MAG: ROK family glucokinase [Lachnospiraceae bacterium]|nr:ROK family glucokinase [Lachnospiraceae bacterium]